MTRRIAQKKLLLILALCLVTSLAYWPALRCGFVDYDDNDYITENFHIQNGLTAGSAAWAFSTGHAANWHPLTWLSHMLDVRLYDLRPAGHHLTSLALHGANAALLFLWLAQVTGAFWRSALVAALFALHPAHVESVAWVSERKDVLSTLFALLTLWCFATYARGKSAGRSRAGIFYILSLLLFALGLMSKPMLVTLPFLLLLLDFWPLGRWQPPFGQLKTLLPLLREKAPFFLLSALSCVVTFFVQRKGGATVTTLELPIEGRLANVLVSYVRYLGEIFWPARLAVFYPRPAHWPLWQVAGAAILLLGITALVFRLAASRRFLALGWLWFLGALVPVIGLVQVGEQAMADRYTYIPSIGIFIGLVWGLEPNPRASQSLKFAATAAAACVLAVLLVLTWRQTATWETTETLFRQALAATTDNPIAEEYLAGALCQAGRFPEAEGHALAALRIKPDFPEASITYAVILTREGRFAEARPRLEEVLSQSPRDAAAHFALAQVCALSGDISDAIPQYQEGLRLKPGSADALNNLAWIRATHPDPAFRNGVEAVQLAQLACELTLYRRPIMLGTLAAAYAEAGRFPEAIATARQARDLGLARGQTGLADKNQELLDSYQLGKPWREPAQTNSSLR